MNPIREYIKAVTQKLPDDRRSLVSDELTATLQEQREALEKSLGRKAREDDLEKLVAGLSPPEQAAERYGAPKGSIDLIERYLLSIQRKLPLGVATFDIVAELREVLTAKIEAKQDAEGRPVTTEEIATILREFGSPDIVAYRYRTRPALIGSELAPYFWTIQRVAIGVMFAIVLLAAVIDGVGTTRPVSLVISAVWKMWEVGIFTFGFVTLAFIVGDAWAPKWRLDKLWNPNFLPETSMREPKTRFESLFALVFDAIFILWWTGVVSLPKLGDVNLSLGPVPAMNFDLHLHDAWTAVHAPILLLAILTAVVHFTDILHPGWSRARAIAAILGCLGGIVVVSLISRAPELVAVTGSEVSAERAAHLIYWLTTFFRAILIFMAVIWAIEIAFEVRRLMRSMRQRGGSLSPA